MLTRRAFLAGASGAATLAFSQRGAGQGLVVTRRSLAGMPANDPDLVAMRRAVAAMKALPASDPRNWIRFSELHGDFCPHSNWYFMPWHRAYIVTFERIVRQLSGKPDFALPYWDWSVQRRLPPAFAAGTPRTNPLNHPRPSFGRGDVLPDDMVGAEVMARVLSSPDYEALGSTRPRGQNSTSPQWQRAPGIRTELEFNPHDGVHGTLGGDMAFQNVASRDPIFFAHHANVDRIWSLWNRRGNDNSNESNWLNFRFAGQFFYPDGTPWNTTVEELQSTPALGYDYDGEALGRNRDDPAEAFAADPVVVAPQISPRYEADDGLASRLQDYRRMPDGTLARSHRGLRRITAPTGGVFLMAAADNEQTATRERPVAVPVGLGRPLAEVVRPASAARNGRAQRQCVWAVLRDIEPPADSGTRVRVFVNCGTLSPATPVTDPSYVTTLSFFTGSHAGHHAHAGPAGPQVRFWQRPRGGSTGATGTCASVDLGPALARMGRGRELPGDRLVVQLVPVGGNGDAAAGRVKPRRVEVAII